MKILPHCLAILVFASVLSTGCDSSPGTGPTAGGLAKNGATPDQNDPRARSGGGHSEIVVDPRIGQSSPAHVEPRDSDGAAVPGDRDKPTPPRLSIDSPPEEVCQEFLTLLSQGELFSARLLLTDEARLATVRAGLELDAPGDAGTTWSVLPARYATHDADVAQVDCVFRQANGTGEAAELTWILRRAPNGWKVFGMIVRDAKGRPDLLSFENPVDLARIHQSVEGGEPARQAAEPGDGSEIR